MFYIRGRKLWGASQPNGTIQNQDPSHIRTIVVHHTAGACPSTAAGSKREMRNMQRFHQESRGWTDIGYNIVIDRFGTAYEGRGILAKGAHTANCNSGTIGISFMGNYSERKLNFAQRTAFKLVLRNLAKRGVDVSNVKGHRQMPRQSTACPGRNIMSQLGL